MYNIIYNICLAILETKPSFIFGLRGIIGFIPYLRFSFIYDMFQISSTHSIFFP